MTTLRTRPSTPNIPLLSGPFFDPFDPSPESVAVVTWPDIAWGLSNAYRFGGQSPVPISVGAHTLCVLGAARRLARPDAVTLDASPEAVALDREMAIAALLHDASEAILGDIPTPFKRHPAYAAVAAIESALQEALNARFGAAADAHRHPVIREADTFALAVEAWLGHGADVRDWGYAVPERWYALSDLSAVLQATDVRWGRGHGGYLSSPVDTFRALLRAGSAWGLCATADACAALGRVEGAGDRLTAAPWWPEGSAP